MPTDSTRRSGPDDAAPRKQGLRKLTLLVHAEFIEALRAHRQEGESTGETVERLILGTARECPSVEDPDDAERSARRPSRNRAQVQRYADT